MSDGQMNLLSYPLPVYTEITTVWDSEQYQFRHRP